MKSEVTWADIRKILDVLEIEDAEQVTDIHIDPDWVEVEHRYGLRGFRTERVLLSGDRNDLKHN